MGRYLEDSLEGITLSGLRRLSSSEASKIIESLGLQTVECSWHYSWNIERFFAEMFLCESQNRIYVLNPNPLHEWAPAPLFSNDHSLGKLIAKEGKNCPFWMVKLSTFEGFLARRSALSGRPSAHFPSQQTYVTAVAKMNCRIERFPLIRNEGQFVAWYDKLKHPKYNHPGTGCLSDAIQTYAAPIEWFWFCALIENGTEECKAVQLMIGDQRSCSAINAAAERKSGIGYGILLDVELVRLLSADRYTSLDCGVSESYGGYKEKVYIDRIETDSSGQLNFLCD